MTLTAPDLQTPTGSTAPTGQELLDLQRAAYRANPIPDLATRLDWLDRVEAMLVAHADEFAAALDRDFGTRPETLSVATEIVGVMPELAHMRKHLGEWMKVKKLNPVTGRAAIAGRLRRDPLGVVGVIGAWNFPVQLTILPAATALAAGNRVVIRPSELTPETAQVLADAVARWFEPEVLAVVLDEVTSGPEFASLRFDHLFFTGSPKVGALVAQAAAANLVPHTLELGGKNPTIVHSGADVPKAAAQIARARLINGGQVCLCPDYVWVPNTVKDQFIDTVLATWRSMVPTVRTNPEYTSIVNDANYQRVVGLIDDAVAHGAVRLDAAPAGEQLPDAASRKIAPTILTGVDESMAIDSEEVFGPVLAVYGYDYIDEPVEYIASRPSPLTLYWYGPDNADFEWVQTHTRSGSVNANDFAPHMMMSNLPFGGVGNSGYGAYHGEAGFDTFTHARSVAVANMPISLAAMTTPPFTRSNALVNKLQLAQVRRRTKKVRPLH